MEERDVIVVDDPGIGMDREIIERYLLQVGRSYYRSEAFRRSFPFIPTSRFGVGCLSVFAVSDRVTVETFKPTSKSQDGSIRIVLQGPRSYMLTERGERQRAGTRIEVVLREQLTKGQLTQAVREWCKRVEFPIEVDEFGEKRNVRAERPEEFVYEMPDVTEEGAVFFVRAFPIMRRGLEGEIYVLGRRDGRGESWAAWNRARYAYPTEHPQAVSPRLVESIVCLHGLTVSRHEVDSPLSTRIDYRGVGYEPALGRHGRRVGWGMRGGDPAVLSRCEEIVRE
jgi:hypothetical protein